MPAGISTVATAGALCDPPWFVTVNGRTPGLPCWSGKRSGTLISRSASDVAAHTGRGSEARVWSLLIAIELQAIASATAPACTVATYSKLAETPAASAAGSDARMASAPAAVAPQSLAQPGAPG